MKKIAIIAALAALSFASCQKEVPAVPGGQADGLGTLNVSFGLAGSGTKAVTPYLDTLGYEAAVRNVQILVFNGSTGDSVAFVNNSAARTQSLKVPAGTYTVCVLANGPALAAAQRASLDGYRSVAFSLGDNSTDATSGKFVMSGEVKDVTVTASSSTDADVTVSRYASRVALQKVTNNTGETLSVDACWLANVVGNQTVKGEDDPSAWYNKFSRADETPLVKENIITSATAGCADLTFRTVGSDVASGSSYAPEVPALMYGFANGTESVVMPFATTFSATKTRLVVKCTANGKSTYYPYDLAFTDRNTAHTVEMVISGEGLDDPQGDPEDLKKDNLTVRVSVAGWTAGEVAEVKY